MKRIIALLTVICLLLAGCELPALNLGTETSVPTEATEEMGIPFYDENGNRIGSVISHRDENGVVLKEELRFDDGTIVVCKYQYGPDGEKTGLEYTRSDGSSGVETFYKNGSLQTSTVLYADGTKIEKSFDESGVLLWDSAVYTDGSKTECTYYEDGKLKSTFALCLDGTSIECSYHENGIVASFKSDGPGGLYELNYTEEGAPVGVERETGTPSSINSEAISGDVAGVMSKEYNAEGYLSRVVIEYEDRSRFEESYFGNGITYRRLTKDNAANRVEWYFYDNGTVQSYKIVTDKINYSNFVLPNGKFGQQQIIDYNADVQREFTYDMNGTIIDRNEVDLS